MIKNNATDTQKVLRDFISNYGERAFQFAYSLSGNIEEAKNLVQETCYRVIKNWERYDPSKPLDPWFFTILRNAFFDARKRYERRHTVALDTSLYGYEDIESYKETIPDDSVDILEQLERKETAQAVRRALKKVSKQHRNILKLRDMEVRTYRQTAEMVGIPINTVRSRLSRARRAFRDEFILISP